jgi:hypothetical protein
MIALPLLDKDFISSQSLIVAFIAIWEIEQEMGWSFYLLFWISISILHGCKKKQRVKKTNRCWIRRDQQVDAVDADLTGDETYKLLCFSRKEVAFHWDPDYEMDSWFHFFHSE